MKTVTIDTWTRTEVILPKNVLKSEVGPGIVVQYSSYVVRYLLSVSCEMNMARDLFPNAVTSRPGRDPTETSGDQIKSRPEQMSLFTVYTYTFIRPLVFLCLESNRPLSVRTQSIMARPKSFCRRLVCRVPDRSFGHPVAPADTAKTCRTKKYIERSSLSKYERIPSECTYLKKHSNQTIFLWR